MTFFVRRSDGSQFPCRGVDCPLGPDYCAPTGGCRYRSSAEEAREANAKTWDGGAWAREKMPWVPPPISGTPPSPQTTQLAMSGIMDIVFDECRELRKAGQLEYAGKDKPAFANFERVAADLDLSREKVLWIFAMKHRDGIANYLNGHQSQREDVRGRINDLITYLVLLRGMLDEGSQNIKPTGGTFSS